MVCKRCMAVMATGTTYEQKKDGKSSVRRFHECKRCGERVYTREPNFQEYMYKALENKSRIK